MIKQLIIASILVATAFGCCRREQDVYVEVTVLNTGLEAADGCGWMIKSGSTYYKPVNLPSKYQIDGSTINVSYHLLNTNYSCGLGNSKYPEVSIDKIK